MQHFTLVARKGSGPDRACAIFPALDLKTAARQSESLKSTVFGQIVDRGSEFAVRASSRREVDLLQRFLASCDGIKTKMYLSTDLDGLLARRQDLILSFFMALYFDPRELRKRLGAPLPMSPPPAAPGGSSGGVTREAQEVSVDAVEQSAESSGTEAGEAESGAGDNEHAQDDAVDNSSQIDILASIASGDNSSTRDQHIDLGDDELI